MTHKDLTIDRQHIPRPSAEQERLESWAARLGGRGEKNLEAHEEGFCRGYDAHKQNAPSQKHTSIPSFQLILIYSPIRCFVILPEQVERKLRGNASSGSGSRRFLFIGVGHSHNRHLLVTARVWSSGRLMLEDVVYQLMREVRPRVIK